MDGVVATRTFKEKHKASQVVILTSHGDEYLGAAFEAGAKGYVLKSCTRQQLAHAVREVFHGQVYVDPSLTGNLIQELSELRAVRQESLLTPRQLEILRMVAAGLRYKDIASKLFINERTVNREVRRIFDRLGVDDAVHGVSEAYKQHLL